MTLTIILLLILFVIIQLLSDNMLSMVFDSMKLDLSIRVIFQPILWIFLIIYLPKWSLGKLNEIAIRYDRNRYNQ